MTMSTQSDRSEELKKGSASWLGTEMAHLGSEKASQTQPGGLFPKMFVCFFRFCFYFE